MASRKRPGSARSGRDSAVWKRTSFEFVDSLAEVGGGAEDGSGFEERALDEGAGFVVDEGEPVGVDEVALGEGDDAGGKVEKLENFEMFASLGHDGVIGGDDEEGEVEPGGTCEHVSDEAFVAGDIDEGDVGVSRGRGRRSRGRW